MGCGSSVEAPASGGGDERPTPTPPGERPPVTEPTTQPSGGGGGGGGTTTTPTGGAGATPQWGGGNWWEAPLEEIVVVRKEARRLPPDERARIGAAIKKMMTNDGGKGSSQFYRLAAIHGGFPPLSRSEAPEYCVHGRESFPNWHRPYLLDFERTMRRADKALGGDGNLGLPYWDWTDLTVNGEVMPGVVRKEILDGDSYEFPSDFFPVEPHRPMRFKDSRSDRAIRRCAQFWRAILARNSEARQFI